VNPARTAVGRRRDGERGFALLFVFLMASSIAILFYLELPRATFESQRVKESMLIERGEQYSRAVKLYVRKWNKYPANLEELENTNSIRYLRRRYKDPLTGKEEWRLVHVGPGGVFTDSLVYDRAKNVMGTEKDKEKGKTDTANTFISAGPAFGSTDPLPGTKAESGSRFRIKRPWERDKAKKESPDGSTPVTADASQSSDPNAQNTSATAGSSQAGGPMPGPFPTMPQTGATGTGMTPAASNQAMDMIRRILTTPRQGGFAGMQSAGTQIGGGLAGVASKAEEEGIKVYNERTVYNEWEFVYDIRKDAAKATAAMTGSQGTTGPGMGIGTGTGTGVMPGMNSPIGAPPGQGR
jgi:hypothetical protein